MYSESRLLAKRRMWTLAGITILGLILRLMFLGHKCFWQDEGITWWASVLDWRTDDASPALFFVLLSKWILLFGKSEFAGRLFSVLWGTLFIPSFYLLGRRLFEERAALLGAFLIAISPYSLACSQEMRMYSLLGLEITLALYFFWHIATRTAEERIGMGWWIGLFLVSAAGLNTHAIFAFSFLFLTGLCILSQARRSWKKLPHWGLLMLAVGIAYLPEMIRTSSRSGGRKHIFVRADPHAILENANFVINSFLEFVVGFSEKVTNLSALIYNNFLKLPQRPFFWLLADSVFIIGAILVMIMVFRRKKIAVLHQNSGLIFALAFFLFNFLLLILLEVSRSIQMISLYIAFMLLLSHFLTRAQLLLRRIAVIALVLISLLMLWDYYPQSYFSFEQANWRSAGQYLSSYASPEDLIFFTGGRNGLYTLKYYCPETMNNLKYIRGHSWQQDPYQVDVQLFPQSQIQPYLQDMMGQYPKIWLVMMGGPATFSPQCPDLHPMETHCFGPQLTVFCLRMVKDK